MRDGTTRLEAHAGLQEAFGEYKIHDLSPNYDFLSVRAGIQDFSSDFRGFLFVDEQPGVRLFGNLHSDRWEYNAAYFNLLEKDTNSGLNTFEQRHQQVIITNFYMQDFIKPGYTTEFSIHYNKDDPSVHYDDNGFLVRPAPVGIFQTHEIRAAYLGWTLDAFDFFLLTFVIADIAKDFSTGIPAAPMRAANPLRAKAGSVNPAAAVFMRFRLVIMALSSPW